MKLKVDSVINLITNSSTVIYSYANNAKNALTKIIEELAKTLGIKEKASDMFYICELFEDEDNYYEYYNEEVNGDLCDKDIDALIKDIKNGKEKPKWMSDAEEKEDYNGYSHSTELHIIPKDEKYKELAKLFRKFLYSTDYEACYDS